MQNKLVEAILAAEAEGDEVVKNAEEEAAKLIAEATKKADAIKAGIHEKAKSEALKAVGEVLNNEKLVEKFKGDYEKQAKELKANAPKKYPAVAELVLKYVKENA